jgi:putative tricarboxylic transport membrane protein
MEEGLAFMGEAARIDLRVVLHTWKKLPRYGFAWLRSMFIGLWMGITPGGPTAAPFMSYGIAKRFSRRPPQLGNVRCGR